MNPLAEIGRERRRQIQVRKLFEAVLADPQAAQSADLTEFYIACGDYMLWSMDRLHDQDQLIHDFLKQRIPADDTDAHQRLQELDERQDRSRVLMEEFRAGLEKLRAAGRKGLETFEAGAKRFVEKFNSLLAPRKNPFHKHTEQLFTDEDWVVIAAVTDDSLATEEALFVAVRRTAPDGFDPDRISVEHH